MVAVHVMLPVRRVAFRHSRAGFVPCDHDDSRASMVVAVDQLGRPVEVVHSDAGEVGFMSTAGSVGDSAGVAAWIAAHPKVTAFERRCTR